MSASNIETLDQVIRKSLQENPITQIELIGFFRLKLVEFEEEYRQMVGQMILKQRQEQAAQEFEHVKKQGRKAS